jgi:hypothetical protein
MVSACEYAGVTEFHYGAFAVGLVQLIYRQLKCPSFFFLSSAVAFAMLFDLCGKNRINP